MAFLTDTMKKGYTEEEIFAVLFEDKKRRRMLAIVTKTVDAHRLQKMRHLLTFEKLATWRRMDGFDRVVDGEDNWFHGPRSLPPTPQEFNASLRSELQELKNAISMPAETTETRPWQKTMDFVDGLKAKLPNEELAVMKRYVEKRGREAAQAHVTVTPVDFVQHCRPCPLDSEMPADVCMRLESKMGPELKKLESPSAGMGLETPGQQCLPNEGTWDQGRTTADGFLTAGVGSNQRGNISSPTEHVGTQTGTAATPKKRRHKTTSEENKQFDPGGKGEKTPLWNAAVTYFYFFWGELGGSLLVLRVFCLCFVCACLLWFLNYCSIQVITSQRAE